MAKNAISKTTTTTKAVAEIVKFDDMKGWGFEGLEQEDYATPRLKVLMALSPEITDETVPGAKPGMIYNSVTQELYDGTKGILVLPCGFAREYVEWSNLGTGTNAPVNVYPATSDILSQTTRDNMNKDRLENGNYIETCANHFLYVVNEGGQSSNGMLGDPALITLKSTAYKKSKKFNSLIRSVIPNNWPMFSGLFRVTTTKQKNDKGSWHSFDFSFERLLDQTEERDVDLFNAASSFALTVKKGEAKVSREEGDATKTDEATPF